VIQIDIVPPEKVEQVFPFIHSWVVDCLGVDKTYSPEDIMNDCARGAFTLRLVHLGNNLTGFFISCVIAAPQGKFLYGAWLGGRDLQDWVKEGLGKIEEWGRANGCLAYGFIGRKAWKKLLGYDYEGVYYYKNL